jgi:hypothetical protein
MRSKRYLVTCDSWTVQNAIAETGCVLHFQISGFLFALFALLLFPSVSPCSQRFQSAILNTEKYPEFRMDEVSNQHIIQLLCISKPKDAFAPLNTPLRPANAIGRIVS